MLEKLKIPIISFFTGGGFLDMGFEEAGFDTIFSNEYIPEFAELFKAGMNTWSISKRIDKKYEISSTESIATLTPDKIECVAFPHGKPKMWGIIGGPPCQDFTMNGKMNGFDGDRGKMTIIFFNRIKKMQPTFFVMENVTGLLHNKDNRERLDRIIEGHCKQDYYLDRFTLNAIDYGVPQNRERVFIIGLKKDSFNPTIKENSDNELFDLAFDIPIPKYKDAIKTYIWPSMNPFGDNPIKPENIPKDLCVESCLISKKDIENKVANINEFFPFRKNPEERKRVQEGDTGRQSFKRLHRYRYSPTSCYGNNEVHLHPYENRRISIREALRIQGVSDNYVLPEKIAMTKKFKMIGNGVPVPLAYAVASTLKNFINVYNVI